MHFFRHFRINGGILKCHQIKFELIVGQNQELSSKPHKKAFSRSFGRSRLHRRTVYSALINLYVSFRIIILIQSGYKELFIYIPLWIYISFWLSFSSENRCQFHLVFKLTLNGRHALNFFFLSALCCFGCWL